jgi:hypothetical protein
VPHQGFDAIAAVYVANLLAHRIEPVPDTADPESDFAQFEEDLASLGVLSQVGPWQDMMNDIPALIDGAEDM